VTDEFNTTLNAEPAACPFVAFEDDRDHRSDAPDYRHRCFASAEPEPRAFPHQERYCLSAGFTGCPIFLDWARQEAAGVARSNGAAGDDRVAAAVADESAPAFLSSRPKATSPAEAAAASRRAAEASAGLWSNEGGARRTTPTAPPAPSSLVVPPIAMARRGPTHPGWETPPRLENFPRLRSRDERSSNAPLIGAAVGVAVVMVALVLLPLILGGHGSATPVPSGSPKSTGSDVAIVTSASPSATPNAGPTPMLYTVGKAKDDPNLTAIAIKFNTSVALIVAYNSTIPGYEIQNANVIFQGMQFYIPPVGWTPPPATPSPTPRPSATPSAP
jgi:hypothetical protein